MALTVLSSSSCHVEPRGANADAKSAPCGERTGKSCGPHEYCAYEPGQQCGAADATATCKPRPEVCTEEYKPVCGCDGKDYGNACAAARAGTGVLKAAVCQ